jgi:hypothetical protein
MSYNVLLADQPREYISVLDDKSTIDEAHDKYGFG